MGDWEHTFGEAGMSEGHTGSFNLNPKMVKKNITLSFATADEARQWAKEHPGYGIVRNPKGGGYIANVLEWYNEHTGESYLDCEKEEHFKWLKEKSRRKNAVNYARECMNFFTNREAFWLYDNGHSDMLLKLYKDYESSLSTMDVYDKHLLQKELGSKLLALLPSPFPADYYPIQ